MFRTHSPGRCPLCCLRSAAQCTLEVSPHPKKPACISARVMHVWSAVPVDSSTPEVLSTVAAAPLVIPRVCSAGWLLHPTEVPCTTANTENMQVMAAIRRLQVSLAGLPCQYCNSREQLHISSDAVPTKPWLVAANTAFPGVVRCGGPCGVANQERIHLYICRLQSSPPACRGCLPSQAAARPATCQHLAEVVQPESCSSTTPGQQQLPSHMQPVERLSPGGISWAAPTQCYEQELHTFLLTCWAGQLPVEPRLPACPAKELPMCGPGVVHLWDTGSDLAVPRRGSPRL